MIIIRFSAQQGQIDAIDPPGAAFRLAARTATRP